MSRTFRRGKPSRNFAYYMRLGVIDHENQSYCFKNDGVFTPYWYDGKGKTYAEYVAETIRVFHTDYRTYRFNSVPRDYRRRDRDIQKVKHFQAIRKALSTGDFDLCLTEQKKFNTWDYW